MSWLRIEGRMPQHRKVAPLSDRAFRLHVTAQAWCVEEESDGHIPAGIPQTLTAAPRGKALKDTIAELVAAGLWEVTGDGHTVHDFLKYNPSHAQQEALRAATKLRVQRHRNAVGNAVTRPLVTPTPIPIPIPDPDLDLKPPTQRPVRLAPEPAPEPPKAPAAQEQEVVVLDLTDSDGFSACPPDLHERAQKLGVIAELADKLRVAPESLMHEARQYVEHWTITNPGERRNRWMSHLRRRLVKRARAGELTAPGALEHSQVKATSTGLPDGWTRHPALPGCYLDANGMTRRRLPGEERKAAAQ